MTQELPTIILLSLIATAMITTQIVGILRDADWWVITRDTTRGQVERAARSLGRASEN